MIKQMLAIWSLVLLPFLNLACTSGSSWFMHCWSLAWRILSITFLQCEMKWSESCSIMSDSLWPHRLYSPWNSQDQNTGVDSLSLLQEIFPTQGLNPGFLHCRHILYQLSHKGSPRILEWVAYPFSSGSFWPRNWTRVSCIAGGLFTSWTTRNTWAMPEDSCYTFM